jgi:hypothetical protein
VKVACQLERLETVVGEGDAEAGFSEEVAFQVANERVLLNAEDDGATRPGWC